MAVQSASCGHTLYAVCIIGSLVVAHGGVSTAVVSASETCRGILFGEDVDRVRIGSPCEFDIPVLLVPIFDRLVALFSVNIGSASATRELFKINSLLFKLLSLDRMNIAYSLM